MKIFTYLQIGGYSFLAFVNFFSFSSNNKFFSTIYNYSFAFSNRIYYLSYTIFLEENIFDSFELYAGLDSLYSMFANEVLLLIFWLHFLAISLFVGSWIVRDSENI